ncbi:MAG TPA: cysteine desulfurase family protein [Haliangiales bacterium]|nr:cysteine desulfurase family protein [Haliangiales bacterium]
MRIDFDHNATTRLDPRVRGAMQPFWEGTYGNPSSIHEEGRRARDAVERARADVAALVGGAAAEIVFTSGGTEADFLGVVGAARAMRARGAPAKVVSSALEHPAVRGALDVLAGEGFAVALVPVDAGGRLDVGAARAALAGGAALAAFALANHELGNVYDVAALAAIAHEAGALVHTDAVQAAGKIPIDVGALGVDLLAISAHKIHGPKGVGALWVRRGVDVTPLHSGGHQERGMRPGTENVAGIVGLGSAARLARAGLPAAVGAMRDRLEEGLVALGARVHGDRGARVPNTTNVGFAGVPGDVLTAALDLEGFAVSTGAACTSGSVEPSPVVLALGLTRERAAEAVRFSLGADNEPGEVERVLALLPRLVDRIRSA